MSISPSLRSLLASVLLAAASLAAIGEEPVLITSTATTIEGSASILVRVFYGRDELKGPAGGVEVFINRRSVGRSPYSDPALLPGTYLIGVAVPGYRSRETTLVVEERRDYELVFSLEKAMGFVFVEVTPPDAEIIADDKSWGSGIIELPEGLREIRARRFGYVDGSVLVNVVDGATSQAAIVLEAATFTLSQLSANRTTFNPANAGPFGTLRLEFRVGSFGSGRLDIRDENDTIVFTRDFSSFETWNQRLIWNGRDSKGRILEDGTYVARLVAGPLRKEESRGSEAAGLERSLELSIDSTQIARPYGGPGGRAGLVYLPETHPSPTGLGSVDVSGGWDFATGRTGFGISATWSSGLPIIGLSAESSVEAASSADLRLGAGLVWPLLAEGRFAAALASRLAADLSSGSSAILGGNIALPLSLDLAGAGASLLPSLGFAPALSASWALSGGSVALGAALQAGLSLAASAWRTGASASLDFSGIEAGRPTYSGIGLALEGRIVLDPSPLVISASLIEGLDAGGLSSLRFEVGLGLYF
jgi:hypothetical protein